MRQILLMILAAAAVDGGAITSGNIDFPDGGFSVSLSGADFSATIDDNDDSDYFGWGRTPTIPFPAPSLSDYGYFESGSGVASGVTYGGVFYSAGEDFYPGPPLGTLIASNLYFALSLESPEQIITGPGTYPQTYAVQLNFCVGVSGSSPSYCENDTDTATGAWIATEGNATFVFLPGIDLTIVPEPSTLSYVGFAIGFVAWMAMKSRRNETAKLRTS